MISFSLSINFSQTFLRLFKPLLINPCPRGILSFFRFFARERRSTGVEGVLGKKRFKNADSCNFVKQPNSLYPSTSRTVDSMALISFHRRSFRGNFPHLRAEFAQLCGKYEAIWRVAKFWRDSSLCHFDLF